MSLITSSRIKAVLGIPAGVTFHDSAIGYAVDYANDTVLRAIGQQTLAVTTSQEYPKVYDIAQDVVVLKHSPVVSIVALTNDTTALTAADYYLDDSEAGTLRLKQDAGYWNAERQGVQVFYVWGYDSNTIPTELVACAQIIALASYNRGKHQGLVNRSASGYSFQLSEADMPPEARAILARYEDVNIL